MASALDFFISYTCADERWAEWIAWELEQAGYTTKLMAWDFRPGMSFPRQMQEASVSARRTLAVLSPAYLQSAFCAPEWEAAFVQDPTATQQKLLPVRIAECQPPGLLARIVYLDLVSVDEATARKKLLGGVQTGRAKPATAPGFPGAPAMGATSRPAPRFPGALPRVWTVPFAPNPCFSGRDALLGQMDALLAPQGAGAGPPLLALHGMGGVGKTQLAVAYAYGRANRFDAVLWVEAGSAAPVHANVAGLASARALDLPEAETVEQAVQESAVLRWLREHDRWLLIFDNADEAAAVAAILEVLPPVVAGTVLITTRRTDWPATMAEVSVKELEAAAAADFLVTRTQKLGSAAGSRTEAQALAGEVGHLPLALEQAAAYVLRHRVTFAEYRRRLAQSRGELLREAFRGATQYPRSVAETWRVQEGQLSAQARALLRLMAHLAPAEMPRGMLATGSEVLAAAVKGLCAETGEPVPAESAEGGVEAALVELADGSLITLGPAWVTCHRLVQAVQADRVPPARRNHWIELTLKLVWQGTPSSAQDVKCWPEWAALRPHVEVIAGLAAEAGIAEPTSELTNGLGIYLYLRGQYSEAEPLFRRALETRERVRGPEHPDTLKTLNNLANLLADKGDGAAAEPLYRRALAARERVLGPEHPDTLKSLNNLAVLLKDKGDLAGAEPLYRRALETRKRVLGPEHGDTLTSLNNLAVLLKDKEDGAAAEPLFRQALETRERVLGPKHPDTLTSLNNLAALLADQGNRAGAEPLYRRALKTQERVLGLEHPDTLTSLNNLGELLRQKGNFGEAEPLSLRALETRERVLGPEHPDTLSSLNNMAHLLAEKGELAEAQRLLQRAVNSAKKVLGEDHPCTLQMSRDLIYLTDSPAPDASDAHERNDL